MIWQGGLWLNACTNRSLRSWKRSLSFEVSCLILWWGYHNWQPIMGYTFVVDWCHMSILISLEQVIEGRGLDNITKVVMGVLKKHGVFFMQMLLENWSPLELMVWLFSKGCAIVSPTKFKIGMFPIWKGYITWHIALT